FVRKEVLAWEKSRNNKNAKVKWQFATEDARIKLTRLYPTFDE
ncbi:MAG TPA: IS630 family transposase, partial [Candidatus Limnocylindrales bacterium]|nr:IS630 family transposase [Candidatus Limnocylindrales bacterium]